LVDPLALEDRARIAALGDVARTVYVAALADLL